MPEAGSMSDGLVGVAVAGLAAGLGVAMPLGAVAALLIREGMVGGLRIGAAGAAGVASVDVLYCSAALTAGGVAAPLVEAHRSWLWVISGVVLVAIGLVQLRNALTAEPEPDTEPGPRTSPARCYLRFVGVTLLNPMTLVYFTALAGIAGIAGIPGPTGSGPTAPIVFTVAVALASLGWQLLLVIFGSVLAGERLRTWARPIGLVAALIVIVLGSMVGFRGLAAAPA